MYVSLVKNVIHSSALIEIVHNTWEIIEDHGEKLHELWFSNDDITALEDSLSNMPVLKSTLKNYSVMCKIRSIKKLLKMLSQMFIALSVYAT